MFFIFGINERRKDYDFNQMVICGRCGSYGSYRVFMTCMCLSLFFIPIVKWNKTYYVQTTCCGTVYELDPAIGKRIAAGEKPEILPEHLTQVRAGQRNRVKRCGSCGFETQEDFEYCPKCGRKL